MDRVRCPTCGEEHDLSDIEPCFDRPDAYFAIPVEDRGVRAWNAKELCVLWETETQPRRHFLRVLLPIPIRGEGRTYCWGVWVEVAERDFAFTHDHWADPDQASSPPFPGALANAFPDMPSTLDLLGQVQLVGPHSVPEFFLTDHAHPLATEQRAGAFPERIVEWSARAVHGHHPDL